MRQILAGILICISVLAGAQTTQTPEQIRQRMAEIRRTTNWDDPASAKKANEEIRDLAKKLLSSNASSFPGAGPGVAGGNIAGGNESKDAQKMAEMQASMVDQKMDLLGQIMEAAAAGEGADIMLAEPLREEIVGEYKADDDKTPKNQDFMAEMSYMIIDVSMPGVDLVIEAMPNFKGIKHLVITSGERPTPYNISTLLKNAAGYPLESLAIINFKSFLSSVPPEVFTFSNLSSLSLFNNNISKVPDNVIRLSELKELYIDINPIHTVLPWIMSLTRLEKLGLENTSVPSSEKEQFRHLFPVFQISSK